MRIKFIIFFLFLSLIMFSQGVKNLIVEYSMVQDENGANDNFNEFLISSDNENLYFHYGKNNKSMGIDEVFNDFDLNKLDYVILHKSPTNIIESGWRVLPKIEFFEDDIPLVKWKLLDGEKKILNFNCNKAQCIFRGRTYMVWYTTEIPSKLGPWKLSGLPGLILEAVDSKNMYNYYARKVMQNYALKTPDKFNEFTKKMAKNPIKIKSYIKIQNDFIKELNRRNLSNMPAGSIMAPNQNLREALKEITFDWEIFPEKL